MRKLAACRTSILPIFLLLFLCKATPCQTDKAGEAKLDCQTVTQAAKQLRQVILGTIPELDTQHIHLAVGFSTGYFAQDPLGAEAARCVASDLVDNLLLKDDQLSVYAWETGLWDSPGTTGNPTTVPSDTVLGKRKLHDLWPLTPKAGSRGGHDTEQAIVSIVDKLGASSDTVVVLITNTAASIDTNWTRVIGQNSSAYLAALVHWRRMPQVNKSGASVILPFTVILPDGRRVARGLDAVLLVPRVFSSRVLDGASRSQRLAGGQSAKVPAQANKSARSSGWWPALSVATLLLLAGVTLGFIYRFLNRSQTQTFWKCVENGSMHPQ